MLDKLQPQQPDKILALMGEFKADTRQGKIDLGVGVYKDATGNTPIMRAVEAAEKRILETQTTKAYTALAGEVAYRDGIAGLVLGAEWPRDRTAALATVGGTGAIRQALELARLATPGVTVWYPDPTWPNHVTIMNFMGIARQPYRYFDEASRGVAFDAMMHDLAGVAAGDVVLLHGCCHNPTGADLSADEWDRIAAFLEQRGAIPLVDLAYQGFGDGLEPDAAAARMLASRLPEVLIAASCSKNFGIYRERAGTLMAVAKNGRGRDLAQGTMAYLNRQTYSFPPDHGARIVSTILGDDTLRADWKAELEAFRSHVVGLRRQLAGELRDLTGDDRFGFIERHRGMFSRIGASPEQVRRLREDAAIYVVGDSRINIAGLNSDTVPILARAIVEAGI